MRIGIAALHHETNSFSNIPMDWAHLCRTRFKKETYRNVYTPRRNYSGGFLAKGKELGIEIVPAAANPTASFTASSPCAWSLIS